MPNMDLVVTGRVVGCIAVARVLVVLRRIEAIAYCIAVRCLVVTLMGVAIGRLSHYKPTVPLPLGDCLTARPFA